MSQAGDKEGTVLQSIMSDITGVLSATFLTGDWIALAIASGSVLAAALLMQRGGQIASMTLLALFLFALGGYMRGFFTTPDAAGAGGATGRLAAQFESSLSQFMNMQAGALLAYFLAFMVLILVLYGLKSVLSRG